MKDFLNNLTPEQRRQLANDLKQFDQPQPPPVPVVQPKSGLGWIGAIILGAIVFIGIRFLDTPAPPPVQPTQQIRR